MKWLWHKDTLIHKRQRLKDCTEIYIRPLTYKRVLGNEIVYVAVLPACTGSVAVQRSKPRLLLAWHTRESASVVNPLALMFQIYQVIFMTIISPHLSHRLRSQEETCI